VAHHEDLLVLYRDSPDSPVKGIFFDSEGHVIRYIADATAKAGEVRLVSEPINGEPRFRLTYRKTSSNSVAGEFEIMPPGKTEFSRYLYWTAHRKRAK
jgi:hypothetical protein